VTYDGRVPPQTSPNVPAETSGADLAIDPGTLSPAAGTDRLVGGETDLRGRAARGTLVNGAFLVFLNALGAVRGFIVAGVLGGAAYGLWGLLGVAFGTLFWLAAVGVDDKYIQQDRPDQQAAFQIAFTLQTMLCGVFLLAVLAGVPLFGLLYGFPEIVGPGLAMGLVAPAIALQTPLWVFYRRMQYRRQRLLQAVDPLVSFAVTMILLVAGMRLWALVLGTLAGAWTAGLVIARASPYPLRFRYERGALREYAGFSWPLFLGSASGVLATQIPTVVAARSIGAAAIGAMALAANLSTFTARVDDVVTQTLYPAICAVKDRTDLLFETFSKSNRLALLWAVPCGAGIALFAGDLVPAVLGGKWRYAVPVVQIFGISAAVNQAAFNWTAFFRARGETRPIAVSNVVLLAGAIAVAVPLLLTSGITGYAAGVGVTTLAVVLTRLVYLRRLLPGFPMVRHIARGVAPTVPAVAAALALRAAGGVPFLAEMAVFTVVAAAATLVLEGALLRESAGYLSRRAARPAPGLTR
jgi:O-antigen/teichoic acid export membrane protein